MSGPYKITIHIRQATMYKIHQYTVRFTRLQPKQNPISHSHSTTNHFCSFHLCPIGLYIFSAVISSGNILSQLLTGLYNLIRGMDFDLSHQVSLPTLLLVVADSWDMGQMVHNY